MKTSEKRAAANRRNAQKSTGPKTAAGKAVVALNSLKHGLRASSMAVCPMEAPEDWEAHRIHTLRDLAPAGYLETVLAERIAATLWRLGRVVRFETLAATSAQETALEALGDNRRASLDGEAPDLDKLRATVDEVEKTLELLARLPTMKAGATLDPAAAWSILETAAECFMVELYGPSPDDPENLETFVLPALVDFDYNREPQYWTGWTAGLFRDCLAQVAERAEGEGVLTMEQLLDDTREQLETDLSRARQKADEVAAALERSRRAHLLPDERTMDKVSRYETTLERSLFRTLHELQRLQAARAGVPVPPPTAVDLEVS